MKTTFLPRAMLALSLLAIGTACHRDATPSPTTTLSAPVKAATSPAPPSAPIYPLQLTLRDQNDETINADVFRGHPVIVSMFYGTCPGACPLLVSNIKRIEASVTPAARADARVLLVSFDAERDTPNVLRELAKAHRVDTARWRFAAGADDDARQLANVLGVEYRRGEEGFFSHNSVVTVLDREGRIVARSEDPSADLTALASAVEAFAATAP
jgi:protein SCO1/2